MDELSWADGLVTVESRFDRAIVGSPNLGTALGWLISRL